MHLSDRCVDHVVDLARSSLVNLQLRCQKTSSAVPIIYVHITGCFVQTALNF